MKLARGRILLVIAAALMAGSVSCACASPASADSGRTLAIGDSVMLGARSALEKLGRDANPILQGVKRTSVVIKQQRLGSTDVEESPPGRVILVKLALIKSQRPKVRD